MKTHARLIRLLAATVLVATAASAQEAPRDVGATDAELRTTNQFALRKLPDQPWRAVQRTQQVPDGGTSLLLLAGSLSGLALLRRKFAKN